MADADWTSALVVAATSLLITGLIIFIRYNPASRQKNQNEKM